MTQWCKTGLTRGSLKDEEDGPAPDTMRFMVFIEFVNAHPLDRLGDTFISGSDDASEAKIRGRYAGMQLERFPFYRLYDSQAYSERTFFGGSIDILHPYSVLRILADANGDAPVVWQYEPLVENGYAPEREFVPHALALMRPGIADFFRFIDVSESHPLSGTGNLVKFAEGLAKIDVQNQVVFVFDNDAEGLDAHQKLSTLTLPANMRRIILPELDAFRAFPAEGPENMHNSDINRRAAAFECYLDLDVGGHPPPKVHWTD